MLHRLSDGRRDRGDDLAAIALDVGQQPEAHRQHEHREGEKHRPREDLDRTASRFMVESTLTRHSNPQMSDSIRKLAD